MSGLLPIFPEQRARWSRPRPEPIAIALDGWKQTISEPDDTFPNQRSITFEKDGARVFFTRWWDQPLNPGYPMAVARERPIVVAGREMSLVETEIFEGAPRRVFVLFINGQGHDVGYSARVVIERDADVAEVAAAIAIAW